MDRSQLAPDDAQLIAGFERDGCAVACTHEIFLRLAWTYLRLGGEAGALAALRDGRARLARLARDHRTALRPGRDPGPDPGEAVTSYWVTVIAAADGADQMPARSSREFLWRHPELLDPGLPRMAP